VLRYFLSRIAQLTVVVFGVLIVVFLMLHLVPGDPAQVLFGDAPVPKEQVEAVRHALGLDQPLRVQLERYLRRTLTGDLGRSLKTNRPVAADLARAIPATAELAVAAMAIAVAGGVSFGITSAAAQNSWMDSGVSAVALLGISFPTFWTGLLLIWIFSIKLDWFPITGQHSIRHLVLPAITLGWYAGAIITRLVRSGMLEVLRQDYVRTARAKGVTEPRVLVWHALRNALIPVVTVASIQFGTLLGGTVVVETVFAREGVGRMLVLGILQKDFPAVQGAVLILALAYSCSNLIADLSYGLIDPRIHYT
jgi:ABC-type dipeptide/oligopeptide/nickel transport system permease component